MQRAILAVLGLVLTATVLLMGVRVGDQARFVTWPVVAFTALAAVVAVSSMRVALPQPSSLAIGLLPALVVSYFLPVAPLPYVATLLVLLGGLALNIRGPVAGMAAVTAMAMVAVVVLQEPAVECGEQSVSTSSGPWWIESSGSSSGSGSMSATGDARGDTQIGDHRYAFRCESGRLVSFERSD